MRDSFGCNNWLRGQSHTGYKVHGVRFHTRIRSAKTKTYSCGVLVEGTGEGDKSGVEYHGVLEEVLRELGRANQVMCIVSLRLV